MFRTITTRDIRHFIIGFYIQYRFENTPVTLWVVSTDGALRALVHSKVHRDLYEDSSRAQDELLRYFDGRRTT